MKISSKLALSIASIVLMMPVTGMSANGSGQDGATATVRSESSDSFQQFLQQGRRPAKVLTQLGFQTRISGQCIEDLILCGFAATGTVAACVADLWAGGALTPACAAAFSATGGACAAAGGACGGGLGTPATVRLARAGSGIIQSGSDVFRELTCAAPHRVKSTKVEWANLGGSVLITKITLTCTNNGSS